MKLTPKKGAAIRCHSTIGPTFGSSQNYDLEVWAPNTLCYLYLGRGFTCPVNVNERNYFTGFQPFEITEMEVFEVTT